MKVRLVELAVLSTNHMRGKQNGYAQTVAQVLGSRNARHTIDCEGHGNGFQVT